MPDIVIAAYRPKPGKAAELRALVSQHVPYLRGLGLATDRPETMMQAKDGTVIEVFEWRDGGITAAHEDPRLHDLWARFGAVCDYVPLASLAEAQGLFAGFTPLA
jgi:hypothetical protein